MTKKQEQAAEAATAPEITGETEVKTEHKTPCVYCGPSVRGVARQYTVYASGNTPAALETAGTAESILYNKIKNEL